MTIQSRKSLHWPVLILIVVLAAILRFYQLGSIPPSPDWDEVSLGYNAYSILHTGRDEYGKSLPVVIESTGDFKPALYVYLAVPSIALFGLNVFAVRFPAALIGVLAVIATYFLTKTLFKRESISLLSAFFLAISPWHLQFTHAAFEASVGDAFIICTVLFFMKGLQNRWYFLLAILFAGVNINTYQSERLFTPLLCLLLVGIFWQKIRLLSFSFLSGAFVLGLLLITPTLAFFLTTPSSYMRLQEVSIFSLPQYYTQTSVKEVMRDKQNHDVFGQIIDNRRFFLAKTIIANYVSHFDPNWLFITGDSTDRHQVPQMGHLYVWDLLFILSGIFILVFGQIDRKIKYLIIGWFLLVPIPAAITIDVPHAIRTLNFLPLFSIFAAIGFVDIYDWLRVKTRQIWADGFFVVAVLLLIFNILFYLDHYFVQYNYFSSQDWQYGYAQLVPYVAQVKDEYQKVIVSNDSPLDQSYIFFLFYLHYPPEEYQQIAEKTGHYTTNHSFATFEFRHIDQSEIMRTHPGYLYVTGYSDMIHKDRITKTIDFLNGKPAIEAFKG